MLLIVYIKSQKRSFPSKPPRQQYFCRLVGWRSVWDYFFWWWSRLLTFIRIRTFSFIKNITLRTSYCTKLFTNCIKTTPSYFSSPLTTLSRNDFILSPSLIFHELLKLYSTSNIKHRDQGASALLLQIRNVIRHVTINVAEWAIGLLNIYAYLDFVFADAVDALFSKYVSVSWKCHRYDLHTFPAL